MIIIENFDYLSLIVNDLEKSKNFYVSLFDFDILKEIESEDAIILELKSVKIKLIENSDFEGCSSNNTIFIAFEMDVDDFTDALKDFEDRDIDLLAGPDAEEGGEALFIADPDGYRIKLAYKENEKSQFTEHF